MNDRVSLGIGLILNSALYLVCVFVAGLAWGNRAAACLSICAMGFAFLSYQAQILGEKYVTRQGQMIIVLASVASGIMAGIALLAGIA